MNTDSQASEVVAKYDGIKNVRGFHVAGGDSLKLSGFCVGEDGQVYSAKFGKKKCKLESPFKIESPQVIRTYLYENHLSACSKDGLLQVWDINSSKQVWKSRILPHDELDLAIPIYETDLATRDGRHYYVTTAFGEVREYDIRRQKRPTGIH